jgi:hypothetical protein
MSHPRKRVHDALDTTPRSTARNVKRKTDADAATAAETNSDSSYVSAAAAIFSDGDASSQDTEDTDPGSESELSISSEDPSSESSSDGEDEANSDSDDASVADGGEQITNVRVGSKPTMKREDTAGSLIQRLQHFIPEMKAANQELEKERAAGTLERRNIEKVEDEEGQHIEMVSVWLLIVDFVTDTDRHMQNLGLGVLEEKDPEQASDDGNQSEGTFSDSENNGTVGRDQEEDVLGKLMGHKKNRRKPIHIEEVSNG